MSYGDKPFGLREVKLNPLPTGTAVALPVDRVLKFKETVQSGTLRGGDKIASVVSIADAAEFELEAGGISLEAYALMTGRTVTTSGTTPNQTTTLVGDAQKAFPYFKIIGRALGDGVDDIRVTLYKCKLTDGLSGDFQDGQFFMSATKGIAVDDDVNGVFEFVQRETAAALP